MIPGKCPRVKIQKRFIKKYKRLRRKALIGNIHLLFNDPTHQIHNTIVSKCWQEKGYPIYLPSNTGRSRITILGALNVVTNQFTSIITKDNCDKEMNKEFLIEVRDAYPDNKRIVLILDNASYNRAYCIQDIAKELNIQLIYLPPYSPNLNLIERLWKFLKKKLQNTYFETLNIFEQAIFNFCKNLNQYDKEIKRLISQNFQIIKAA